MTTKIKFHFDPLCPWAWQTSKWIRAVENVRDVDVEWRLFSLEIVNGLEDNPYADVLLKDRGALRTLALAQRVDGNAAVGRVYEALGRRLHEPPGEALDERAIRLALVDAGWDPSMFDRAVTDESTMEDVRTQHEAAVAEVGAFGVPVIVLPSGQGMFGPVIAKAPTGEAAGELWDHVEWLIRQDGFFELKRERDRKPGDEMMTATRNHA
jgi:2-hydroxychromene-2-carboxylate isomerase